MNYPFSGIIVRYVEPSPIEPTPGTTVDGSTVSGETVEALLDDVGQPEPVPLAGHPDESDKDELHVNLWEVGGFRFLDVGVMISRHNSHIQELALDLPWDVKADEIFDLGSRLTGEKIITAIFNDVANYSGQSDDKYATVKLGRDEINQFCVLRLSATHFIHKAIRTIEGGVVKRIVLPLPSLPTADASTRRYVRIRIVDVPRAVYASVFSQKDRSLLSSSAEARIFDFRINVRRGVPDDVLSGERLIIPQFGKIHLFFIVRREMELVFQGEGFKACRSLEDEDVWNGYINMSQRGGKSIGTVRNHLGYQWSASTRGDDRSVKDLVALARFVEVRSSLWNIFRFLVIGVLVSATGSAIWDTTKCKFGAYIGYTDPCKGRQTITLSLFFIAAIIVLGLISPRLWFNGGERLREWGKRGIRRFARVARG